jgi:hypothetical protein
VLLALHVAGSDSVLLLFVRLCEAYRVCTTTANIHSDSKLLSVFPWPIIFKPYVPSKVRMLKLLNIMQYCFYK